MAAYAEMAKDLISKFTKFELVKIPRSENASADALAALAATSDPGIRRVIPVEHIEKPSISSKEVLAITENDDMQNDWRTPIIKYIKTGELPVNKWEARKLKIQSARYTIINDELFKRSIAGPYLRCTNKQEEIEIIKQTHDGSCGSHASGRAMATRIRKQGYYWPTMLRDCQDYSQKCQKCQRHGQMINQPAEPLSSTLIPYPFMKWSMDIVGPLEPSGIRKVRFLLILTDNFSKWVEAEAYASVTSSQVVEMLWKNVICRHGLPFEIITDNGTNLTSKQVRDFCESWRIKLTTSTPRYPQGNGQAEATNKTILSMLKKRLESKKSGWYSELGSVLWAYRTSPRGATGETPFSLLFGMEAMVPAEVIVPSLRRTIAPEFENLNTERMISELDMIDERREQAYMRMQNRQNVISKFYNTKVKPRKFTPGELVLRKVFENTRELNAGKLGKTWEGPYKVDSEVRPGVYKLVNIDTNKSELRPWNVVNLKKFNY